MSEKEYKFGIIGYPIGHSLSSVMQCAALGAAGLKGEYNLLETKPEDLIDRIKTLKKEGYDGFNVTIPHKIPVTLFLSKVDEFANLAGSVNTVKINDDKSLEGYNTDVFGFVKSIPEDINLKGAHGAVLGTGGAARAVVVGLCHLGIKEITLFTRNVIDSHETVENFREKFKEVKFNLVQNELLNSLKAFKIVVNTTPLGMKGFRSGISFLNEELVESLPDDGLVYDIVYNPIKTELINQAIKAKKRYVGGLDMLVYQGARAFEIWTGKTPDIDKMKISVLEKLLD